MEALFDLLGVVSLLLLVLVGLAAGWLAGLVAGRQRPMYYVLGVVGAIAAPFLVAALGLGILAAGGLAALALIALLGAVLILAVARAIFDRR
jgi:uncharacterized membrane protein YeaQ/YmgE (transglycosylase-associated protein family)